MQTCPSRQKNTIIVILQGIKTRLTSWLLSIVVCFSVFFPTQLLAQQLLRIGTGIYYPPYVMSTSNQFFGFDIDYMRNVCKLINRECIFIAMPFAQLFPALQQGKIDAAINSITITPERQKNFLFSYPYMLSYATYLVKTDSKLDDATQLPGKTIGVQANTLFVGLIKKAFGDKTQVKGYVQTIDLINALKDGDVDAIILDRHASAYWQANSSGQFRNIGPPIKLGFGLGIMLHKHNVILVNEINHAIVIIEDSGIFNQLVAKYLGL